MTKNVNGLSRSIKIIVLSFVLTTAVLLVVTSVYRRDLDVWQKSAQTKTSWECDGAMNLILLVNGKYRFSTTV